MRWVACAALGAALCISAISITSAAASEVIMRGGASSSSGPATHKHYKHYKHRSETRFSSRMASCYDAGTGLWGQGYNNIRIRDCSGSTYSFVADANSSRYRVDVDAESGAITFITPY